MPEREWHRSPAPGTQAIHLAAYKSSREVVIVSQRAYRISTAYCTDFEAQAGAIRCLQAALDAYSFQRDLCSASLAQSNNVFHIEMFVMLREYLDSFQCLVPIQKSIRYWGARKLAEKYDLGSVQEQHANLRGQCATLCHCRAQA